MAKPAFSFGQLTSSEQVRRRQPMKRGLVPTVGVGERVHAQEVVAAADIPEEHHLLDLAALLNVPGPQAEEFVSKRVGDLVQEDEVIAMRSGFLGIGRRKVTAPVEGRIAWIGKGKVLLEGRDKREEVNAAAPGRVKAIEPDEFIILEMVAAAADLAWGTEGAAWGTLKVMDDTPSTETPTGRFNVDHRGAIVAVGSPITSEILQEAIEIRVKALIGASMTAGLLQVAEAAEFPVALSKGFGTFAMEATLLDILNHHNGREVAVDVPPPSEWRESPPQIMIPIMNASLGVQSVDPQEKEIGLEVGMRVRVLQEPYFGEIATVHGFPESARQLPGGLWMHGAMVALANSEKLFVPFANLQQLD